MIYHHHIQIAKLKNVDIFLTFMKLWTKCAELGHFAVLTTYQMQVIVPTNSRQT